MTESNSPNTDGGGSGTIFPASVYAGRLAHAADLALRQGLWGLVFGTGPELEYLIGSRVSSHERLTALVVPRSGIPTLVLPAVERGDLPASAVPALDVDVQLWEDGQDPHELVADALGLPLPPPVPDTGLAGAVIGVGSSLTADHLLPILWNTRATPVLASETLRELFMRKDAEEIAQLRDAAAAIDRVHARVPSLLRAGRTEADVAADLEAAIIAEGHSAVDFVIVGSGPNGANPHHAHSDRVLSDGEVVVVDIGGTWGVGYHSDCTRTYVVGDGGAPRAATEAWEVLRRAQEAAVAAVRPGVTAASIDDTARKVIEDAGYGGKFIHRTGHGIGLSLHEEPFIMTGNDLELEPGMAFSVEPGLYFEGEFGMRLEDIVVVTDDGAESLNKGPHELIAGTASESAGGRAGTASESAGGDGNDGEEGRN